MSALDDAVRDTVCVDRPDALVIGWVVAVEYVLPTSENHATIVRTWSAEGQSAAHTIGLHTLATDYYRGLLTAEPTD